QFPISFCLPCLLQFSRFSSSTSHRLFRIHVCRGRCIAGIFINNESSNGLRVAASEGATGMEKANMERFLVKSTSVFDFHAVCQVEVFIWASCEIAETRKKYYSQPIS
ncbi:hypothetical protein OWV82_025446, partial [Melia azedarach]